MRIEETDIGASPPEAQIPHVKMQETSEKLEKLNIVIDKCEPPWGKSERETISTEQRNHCI